MCWSACGSDLCNRTGKLIPSLCSRLWCLLSTYMDFRFVLSDSISVIKTLLVDCSSSKYYQHVPAAVHRLQLLKRCSGGSVAAVWVNLHPTSSQEQTSAICISVNIRYVETLRFFIFCCAIVVSGPSSVKVSACRNDRSIFIKTDLKPASEPVWPHPVFSNPGTVLPKALPSALPEILSNLRSRTSTSNHLTFAFFRVPSPAPT